MQEYMLRILNKGDHQKKWTAAKHKEFVQKCEVYIRDLQKAGKLIAAQPLRKRGLTLVKSGLKWKTTPLKLTTEMQVGYYHIRASDVNDAIEIAKGNPEFEYSKTARVEIRPITEGEESTGFDYPTSSL